MPIQGTNICRQMTPNFLQGSCSSNITIKPNNWVKKKFINGGVAHCKHRSIELLSEDRLSTIHLLSLGLLQLSISWIIAISLGFFTPMTSTFKFLWQFHVYRTHLHHPFLIHDLKWLEDHMVFAQVYEKIYELQQYEFFEYPNLQILHHCLI